MKEYLSHIGDILAIPFFFILSIYFFQLKNKSFLEYILLIFCVIAFVLDILFTIQFIKNRKII